MIWDNTRRRDVAAVARQGASDEGTNIRRLGNYAFLYATLLALGNLGILCVLAIGGIPLYGTFGAIEIVRTLFRGMAVLATMLGLYALSCKSGGVPQRCWRAGMQLFMVAVVFCAFAVDYGSTTARLLDLLQWLGTDCGFCSMPSV